MDTENGENYVQHIVKRKKKRSCLQQFKKKFRKSASFSKGSKFEETEHEYFIRVFELERSFEGTVEEKFAFANNALAQTEGREVECSFNQLISRVIENLLPLASNTALEKYFKAFSVNLRPICVNNYASHVLQALLIAAAKHTLEEDSAADLKHVAECKAWLLKVSTFLLNNIEEFMLEMYANPTLRTAMVCLAGMPQLDKHNKAEDILNETSYADTPEEYVRLLEQFYGRISTWPQFKDLVDNSLSSGYLQCLLRILKPTNSKLYNSLCKKILAECFPSGVEDNASTMFSPTALPVLEVMIEQSKRKVHVKIYNQLLRERLTAMSVVRVASFTIQKFLNKCSKPEMIGEIVTVLAPRFQKIIASRNDGVLVSLCQACERLKAAQTEFLQALMKALNCSSSEDEHMSVAVLSLCPLPHDSTSTLSVTRSGSLLFQSLLKFQKPIKLVNSLLCNEPKRLSDLLSSQYGSYVTGAFCKSESIGEKSRLRLIQRLMGLYPSLAKSKFGSRTFDDIWEVAEQKSKVQIVKDLSSAYSEVMKTQCGQFVAYKVQLGDFKTLGIDRWREQLQSTEAKQKLFAPIIGELK